MAAVLAALQAPPDDTELAGWHDALAAYRGTAVVPPKQSWRMRRPLFPAAAAVALAVFGGVTAAAYTGSLPGGLQKLAHETIAAPAASGRHPVASPAVSHPAAPPVTSATAFAMCKRYLYAEQYGTASQQAAAYRNVVRAAGGPGQVAAFCARAMHPGAASPPGRRVGQTQPPAGHHGEPTSTPGNGNGNGGNGNGTGNGSGGGGGNGSGGGGGNGGGNGHGKK